MQHDAGAARQRGCVLTFRNLHNVRQDYAVAVVERAGFRLVGSSAIDANPRDTADWPKGVWTLPPT